MPTRYEDSHPAFRIRRRGLADAMRSIGVLGLAVGLGLSAAPSRAGGPLGSVDLVTRPDGQRAAGLPEGRPPLGRRHARPGVRDPRLQHDRRARAGRDERRRRQRGVRRDRVARAVGLRAERARVRRHQRLAQEPTPHIAAFYFTELPDAYAARTGRPENVGVIGVAFFRERPQRVAWRDTPARIAANPAAEPAARQDAAGERGGGARAGTPRASATAEGRSADATASRREMAAAAPAPAPMAKIGTGHGRRESSYVQTTRFERESATPNETVAIHYDRRENLIAMGILPPPVDRPLAESVPRVDAAVRAGSARALTCGQRVATLDRGSIAPGAGRSHTRGRCPRPPSPPSRATRT